LKLEPEEVAETAREVATPRKPRTGLKRIGVLHTSVEYPRRDTQKTQNGIETCTVALL